MDKKFMLGVLIGVVLVAAIFIGIPLLSSGTSVSEVAISVKLDQAYAKGNYEEVVERAEAYLEDHEDADAIWNQLGWAYWKLEDLVQAEACFDKSIEINPDSDNAYVGKGVLSREVGNLDEARNCYKKAIEILPDNAEAYSSLAVIEIIEENYSEAIRYGELAWKLKDSDPIVAANLSAAYHYSGQYEKRDKYLEEAENLGYSNMDALRILFAK